MEHHERSLAVYLDLADHYMRQDDPGMREVFLLLAADASLKAGQPDRAEQLRLELLRENPYHTLRPFPSFADALRHPDIESYLDDLRHKYPVEVAQDLLESALPGTLPLPDIHDGPFTPPPQVRDPGPLTPPPTRRVPPPPPAESPEPLKVHRAPPESSEPPAPPPTLPPSAFPPVRPPARPVPPPPPAPPLPRARPAAASPGAGAPAGARSRPQPRPVPPPPRPRPAVPTSPADTEGEPPRLTSGAWVGTLLFLVLLLVGVALAVWALVPQELVQELIQGS